MTKTAAAMGVEGIISKGAHAAYLSDRTRSWLKIKRVDPVVIPDPHNAPPATRSVRPALSNRPGAS